MILALVSVLDTVSAAKYEKIDSGSKTAKIGNMTAISKWVAYSNGETVIAKWKVYAKYPKHKKYTIVFNSDISYKAPSENKLAGTITTYKTIFTPYYKQSFNMESSLTAKSYYYQKLRPEFSKFT
jgi:hypothetical protein